MDLMKLICQQVMTTETCSVVLGNELVQYGLVIAGILVIWGIAAIAAKIITLGE